METTAICFLVALCVIVGALIVFMIWWWLDQLKRAGKEREDMRQATAQSLVTFTEQKQKGHRRVKAPVVSGAIQKNWLAKRKTSLPPQHKTFGKRVLDSDEEYAAGSDIAEELVTPPESPVSPIPISYTPILAPGSRRRSASGPRVVGADVHRTGSSDRSGGASGGAPASTSIQMEPVAGPSNKPMSVLLPMRRKSSPIGPGGVPMYRKASVASTSRGKDPGPKSGQLPQRKRSQSRDSVSSGSDELRSRGATAPPSASASVDPSSGSASFHQPNQ